MSAPLKSTYRFVIASTGQEIVIDAPDYRTAMLIFRERSGLSFDPEEVARGLEEG